jgi:hypothetical protein
MKFRIMALAGAALLFSSAAWADDPMANTYGNSVNTKDEATGQTSVLLFNQDNTYTGKTTGSNGQPVTYSGTWSLKDGGKTICLAPTLPAGSANAAAPSCSPLEAHNVGDSWVVTNDQNQRFDVSITAGR